LRIGREIAIAAPARGISRTVLIADEAIHAQFKFIASLSIGGKENATGEILSCYETCESANVFLGSVVILEKRLLLAHLRWH